jgi:pimeloyl-ACP methyl ester carboxylesterase
METFLETVPEPRRSAMRSEWWAMIHKLLGEHPSWEFPGSAREEAKSMTDSIRQAIAARPLPTVPTILLSASKVDLDTLPPDALTTDELALQAEARRWKMAAYQGWTDATPDARLVIAEGSGHDIASDHPKAVIDAVRDVLQHHD